VKDFQETMARMGRSLPEKDLIHIIDEVDITEDH